MNSKKSITIIGGGASALMLACSLDSNKYIISIYEKNAALGRKFLVAGKGGFNLTHSENLTQFVERYQPKEFIEPILNHFSNIDFRNWLSSIGIETYVGTSKRVFPVKGIKPIEVFQQIGKQLVKNKVTVFYNHIWQGWDQDEIVFSSNGELTKFKPDIVVFALGGASWKVTGSDGNWTNYFNYKGITTSPFYPSNCAYKVNWKSSFIKAHHGMALKNCEFTCGSVNRKGEAVITEFGIEGSGIYPLSPMIRKEIIQNKTCHITVDFKPDLLLQEIISRIENKGKLSIKDVLKKKINLSDAQIDLLKSESTKEQYQSTVELSNLVKKFPITLVDFPPIDDVISTVGGIPLEEIKANLELKKMPNHFCMGEMLDWDAPTGGYLLQACFSMGYFLSQYLNKKVN
jgi:uncharacterized flavoprotein (TIGR03862 family)